MEPKRDYTISGPLPGKHVVIMAGVHGDEVCGLRAFERVVPTLSIDAGKVTFVWANHAAIDKEVRFVESNLNRLFQADTFLSEKQRNSYEYKRSREIMPLLASADALLDIHSSGTPESTPFVICEQNSYEIATLLPVEIISSGWDAVQAGGSDSFVNASGGKGVCIECGYHNDPNAVDRAECAIYAFLYANQNIIRKPEIRAENKTFVQVQSLYRTTTNFVPSRSYNDFQAVSSGEVIGTDGTNEVVAPGEGTVIFVRARKETNEEAFLFLQEISVKIKRPQEGR